MGWMSHMQIIFLGIVIPTQILIALNGIIGTHKNVE